MSDSSLESAKYLYNLPAAAVNEFSRVMDSLADSDWLRFASRVICDQTDLRLVEQGSRRTETLMHQWGCRNGTVGELLNILQDLELLRPRDIILKWRRIPQPSSTSPSSSSVSQPGRPHYSSPPSSLFDPCKDVTQTLPGPESKLLPKPGPPPPDLRSSFSAPLESEFKEEKKEEERTCECRPVQPSLCTNVMCWPLEEVQRGTDNFSAVRQVGEGGFGHVYRASMRNTDFAVKRLKEDSHMGWSVVKESFRTEVERLSQYRHPNIMDLVGYSVGGGSYCLIYVYMPSGSLEDRLHCQNGSALSWSQRVNVLLGSAKAIQYLHSCSPALIHGDVKSSNILLGEHLEPKLGDFGLARLRRNPSRSPGKTSTVAQTSTVRGTLAYLPDEYVKDGQLGTEIDVYSFGVVLLEVLTGRRALQTNGQSRSVYLKDLVSEVEDDGKSFSKGKDSRDTQAAENIWKKHLDSRLMTEGTSGPTGSREMALLACRCLERRRKKRPPMTEVFTSLQDILTAGRAPSRSDTPVESPAVSQHPFTPQPLRSDNCSLDSLAHRFSRLGPREDTYCCPDNRCFPSAETDFEILRSSDARCSSFRAPCESDESQGFSQYLVPTCSAQSDVRELKTVQSVATPMPSGASSDEKVVVNAVRQQLVDRMELYEDGRIQTSDLLSSAAPSYGALRTRSREPEESDEFTT
ncbi:interleukin-1 receptor-associated kinase 1 isoform X2 [Trichomycterus rosablanca]|uniref:interleukin-1 receptor-associated kinase 1 isoform X2 n=1 Tax=Trichomycterus rosablanca TaxID=2290929 RepID=UPI002F351A95